MSPLQKEFLPRASARLSRLLAAVVHGAAAQSVEFFSPQGEVKAVRQVTARFAQAMVAVRRPARGRSVRHRLRRKGQGPLGGHEELGLRLRPRPARRRALQLHASSPGSPRWMARRSSRASASSSPPAVLRSCAAFLGKARASTKTRCSSSAWTRPSAADTIAAHAYCVAAGVNEKIGVRLVTGEERKTILDNRKSFAASYLRFIFLDRMPARTRGSFLFRLPVTGSDDEKFLRLRDAPDSPLVTLACARTLPPNAEVKLVWGKGIASASGRADLRRSGAGVPRAADVSRRVFLRAREQGRAMHSDPAVAAVVHRARSRRATRRGSGSSPAPARVYKPQTDQGRRTRSTGVAFGPGLPENESFRLELPAGLEGRRRPHARQRIVISR